VSRLGSLGQYVCQSSPARTPSARASSCTRHSERNELVATGVVHPDDMEHLFVAAFQVACLALVVEIVLLLPSVSGTLVQ